VLQRAVLSRVTQLGQPDRDEVTSLRLLLVEPRLKLEPGAAELNLAGRRRVDSITDRPVRVDGQHPEVAVLAIHDRRTS
jgi:predicted metalloprotease